MTERGTRALDRSAHGFCVGPSEVVWNGNSLVFTIDEVTVPLPRRVRGRVRVTPLALVDAGFALDADGRHRWTPMAPRARVEASFRDPDLSWSGEGYVDGNNGDRPLEADFVRWDWSRGTLADGSAVLYDVTRRDGTTGSLAIAVDRRGAVERFEAGPEQVLPKTLWRIERRSRGDAGVPVRVTRTLEDTPFYARSTLANRLRGTPIETVHESLSLDRFRTPVVQAMLPFRMPRRGW